MRTLAGAHYVQFDGSGIQAGNSLYVCHLAPGGPCNWFQQSGAIIGTDCTTLGGCSLLAAAAYPPVNVWNEQGKNPYRRPFLFCKVCINVLVPRAIWEKFNLATKVRILSETGTQASH